MILTVDIGNSNIVIGGKRKRKDCSIRLGNLQLSGGLPFLKARQVHENMDVAQNSVCCPCCSTILERLPSPCPRDLAIDMSSSQRKMR